MLAVQTCWARAHLRSKPALTLVTGASSNHFTSLIQFLLSVERHEPKTAAVVYDLGLDSVERAEIARRFPRYRMDRFDYSRYPPHVNIVEARGQYAWKPIIVWGVLRRTAGPVCWMDAGNVLTASLTGIREALDVRGFHSPQSKGTITDWTHPGMLSYFNLSAEWGAGRRNLSGSCVAFHPRHLPALKLAKAWRDGALIADCIAPAGSSRSNHRQDQALLTVLAHKSGFSDAIHARQLDFKNHMDIDEEWWDRQRASGSSAAEGTFGRAEIAS